MTLGTEAARGWQAKLAYACTALFSLTSVSTNAVYGWSKGDTFPSSVIWALVAVAVGLTLILSTAALFKALAARTYGQAAFIALGLLLCATYSVVAAVGSATGQRMSAALSEGNAENLRSEAEKAVAEAGSRIAAIPQTRPSGELQAEIRAFLLDPRLEGCKEINGPRTRDKCPAVADLRKELAKAEAAERERQYWQPVLDAARAKLSTLPAPKVVNSDAASVVSFLEALGYQPTIAQVNTALALLAVLLVELGGSVSLAVGMALSVPEPAVRKPLPTIFVQDEPDPLVTPAAPSREIASKQGALSGLHEVVEPPLSKSFRTVRDRLLMDVNNDKDGLRSTYEALGQCYGVSATRIGQIVKDLKREGIVRVRTSKSGTVIAPAFSSGVMN